jgi:hypothetical protein
VITLPKPSKDPKFPQNLRSLSLLSTIGKLFEKVILKIVQTHTEERGLLNASYFGFSAHHSMTLQCMRHTDVTLNFKNNMSMAAVFLDIQKAFDTTGHLGLLYKLSEIKFSISLIKLINSSFLRENSEFPSKVKCLRQGIYKQVCYNVLSFVPHLQSVYK